MYDRELILEILRQIYQAGQSITDPSTQTARSGVSLNPAASETKTNSCSIISLPLVMGGRYGLEKMEELNEIQRIGQTS
jgi:hypothetical protein